MILPASFGGRDEDPSWYRNAKENPVCGCGSAPSAWTW
ncbi:nitroreductase family deazaflavin-dependent oxidoreductase [Mycobacterium seoulense]|nr:nitroreductase family deazaflavin-dependent oxidoreductase [Mycobacterium seoulense]